MDKATDERCERCDKPECPGPILSTETRHRFPETAEEIVRAWEQCDANAVDWRARAIAAEANHCDALELIDDFKSAIGINVGGDPGGVTPEHARKFIGSLDEIRKAAIAFMGGKEGGARLAGLLTLFAAKYPEE